MRYLAQFEGAIIPPIDSRTQYFAITDEGNPLPKDGLPRITTEGLEILKEGLRGDFSHWVWSIGNHPLELPGKHMRNLIIRAMDDEPHFIAEFWTGSRYPKTKHNVRALPNYCFDEIDDMGTEYRTEPIYYIKLCQSFDFWSGAPIFVDNIELLGDGIEDEDDGDGMIECIATTPKTPNKVEVSALDRWCA